MKFAKIILLAVLFISNVSFAQDHPLPKQIVSELYKPYLADPNAESPNSVKVDCLDAILPYASATLKRAIRKDRLCEQREQGICAQDFDIIINAQDWQLTDFELAEDDKLENRPVIHASFLNGGARNVVNYYFVNEKGAWKNNEIEALSFKKDGGVSSQYKLKESLNKYSY